MSGLDSADLVRLVQSVFPVFPRIPVWASWSTFPAIRRPTIPPGKPAGSSLRNGPRRFGKELRPFH